MFTRKCTSTHTNKYFLVERVPGTSLDVEKSDRFASSKIRHCTAEGRDAALLKADVRKFSIFFKEVRITTAQAVCAIVQMYNQKVLSKYRMRLRAF